MDEEVSQLRQANQDLREGLRQAIQAIESQQEHIKMLEELISSQLAFRLILHEAA